MINVKCPKCGSELDSLNKVVHNCLNADCDVVVVNTRTQKDIERFSAIKSGIPYTREARIKYDKQRLEKVLSKMKKYDKGLFYPLTKHLEINHNKGKFYLVVLDEGTWIDFDEIDIELTENLIKRFGEEK